MAYATADSLGSFMVGDIPLQPVVLTVFDDEGYPQDLDGLTATASLNGVALAVTVAEDRLRIVLPELSSAGVNVLRVKLGTQALTPLRFAVESGDEWVSIEEARDKWRDAPESDTELYELLEVARITCEAYAPSLADGVAVPVNYRAANVMQARNQWNSSRVDPNGQVGADGFQVTVFPLDWAVKALLRPRNPRPVIR